MATEPSTPSTPPATKRRRVPPIHPFLFAAFPLLALYARNVGELPVQQLYRPMALTLAATIGLWAIVAATTKQQRKGAIAASAAVLAFFSYGHLLNLLPANIRPYTLPIYLLAIAGLMWLILRARTPLLDATLVLNLTSIVLVGPSIWNIVNSQWSDFQLDAAKERRDLGLRPDQPRRTGRKIIPTSAPQPDIYYIILDAYGRADTLKTYYGFDNTPFLKELEKRGFYVAARSRANYDQTPLCLASSLNMSYLDKPEYNLRPNRRFLEPCRELLDDNDVAAALSKHGYHYVYVWSGTDATRAETADLVLNRPEKVSSFEGQVLGLTALTDNRMYNQHRDELLGAYKDLQSVPRLPYPKFVFAHILAPHPPFVFGPNGEPDNPNIPYSGNDGSMLLADMSKDEYKRRYIAQLQYINKRTIETVDTILAQSKQPPVIILQGDHGSRMNIDWESLGKTDVREPFCILNAYLVPNKTRKQLYPQISPVNSFRILLNTMFNTHYTPLPDRTYYSPASFPYQFTEVTTQIP